MSSYRRFVKHEEDIDRLPHGMIRTGYDADTRQYTFHDNTTGVQFISAPGERYGTLLPAATANYVKPKRGANRRLTLQAYDRPVLFEASPVVPKQAPRPQPLSKSPVVDEKGHRNWPHVTSSEKMVQPVSRQYLGDKGGGGPRDALRSTVRMLGRSLTTVRRTRSHERQRDHDGYVLV
ncbi:hypothetical protein EDB84DRAFT_935933 [Lactarius hengduanensis]|nr:hypothetical protein EDB84DRAFT_935933 [Lactarius hengduanensis]